MIKTISAGKQLGSAVVADGKLAIDKIVAGFKVLATDCKSAYKAVCDNHKPKQTEENHE